MPRYLLQKQLRSLTPNKRPKQKTLAPSLLDVETDARDKDRL